jgi:hypothetical protein
LDPSKAIFYAAEKVDKKYLPNWLKNLEAAYGCLSEQAREEIQPDYLALLHKTHNLLRAAYRHQDRNTIRIAGMIASAARAARS